MKKLFLSLLFAAVAVLTASALQPARHAYAGPEIRASVGAAICTDSDLCGNNKAFDTGSAATFSLGYRFFSVIGLYLDVGLWDPSEQSGDISYHIMPSIRGFFSFRSVELSLGYSLGLHQIRWDWGGDVGGVNYTSWHNNKFSFSVGYRLPIPVLDMTIGGLFEYLVTTGGTFSKSINLSDLSTLTAKSKSVNGNAIPNPITLQVQVSIRI